MKKRETEIESPTFERIEDFYEYARRRDEPQKFLNEFIADELVTNPNRFPEEEYVEKLAIRYLRFYERRFGNFKH